MSEINNNDYWWDDYVSKLSQFSAEFYSLLTPVYADPLPTQLSRAALMAKYLSPETLCITENVFSIKLVSIISRNRSIHQTFKVYQ